MAGSQVHQANVGKGGKKSICVLRFCLIKPKLSATFLKARHIMRRWYEKVHLTHGVLFCQHLAACCWCTFLCIPTACELSQLFFLVQYITVVHYSPSHKPKPILDLFVRNRKHMSYAQNFLEAMARLGTFWCSTICFLHQLSFFKQISFNGVGKAPLSLFCNIISNRDVLNGEQLFQSLHFSREASRGHK